MIPGWVAAGIAIAGVAVAPGAADAGERDVYALIVTSNRSADLGRPDLQYADDDGAKYYELFAALTSRDRIALLTELDDDTGKLFSDLAAIAVPPTRGNVRRAARSLAAEIRAAVAAGREVDFYFVFAGHGDVDRGRGFLQLADGAFYSADVEALLASVDAPRSHVILDSCNSFFVINPRKPGGRRFSTPRDAAVKLARALPDVGVFLSTSAEAEVYEWSELQSGIFSHAVRSGLSGAADADGDGAISYDELEAFVQVSAAGVRNPLFRPKVFAHAPGGDRARPLLTLPPAAQASLRIEPGRSVRITVRDRDELRWVDVYKEAGTAIALHLPPRVAEALRVDELAVGSGAPRVVRRLEGRGPVELASLTPTEVATAARGPSELLRMLFTVPYGPGAVADYTEHRAADPAPVFGISRDDSARMQLLLKHTAALDRQEKFAKGAVLMGGASVTAIVGGYLLATADEQRYSTPTTQRWVGAGAIATGALAIGAAGILMLRDSHGEVAYARFRRDLSDPGMSAAQAVASAEERLIRMRRQDHDLRVFGQVLGWSGSAAAAVGLVVNEAYSPDRYRAELRIVLGTSLVAGIGGALILRTNITPVERMVEIWHDDPSISRWPRLSLDPMPNGAMMNLSGEF